MELFKEMMLALDIIDVVELVISFMSLEALVMDVRTHQSGLLVLGVNLDSVALGIG